MNGNKEQVMSETKLIFDGEKVVTSVSNGSSNTTVTTTGDSVVISVIKEKTPQDVRDQGEQPSFNLDNNCIMNIQGIEGLHIDRANVRLKG